MRRHLDRILIALVLAISLAIGLEQFSPKVEAQVNSNFATRCNAQVSFDIASNAKGNVVLINSPTIGGIFICGYTMMTSSAINVGLVWGTATTAAVTGSISPLWAFPTVTAATTVLVDSSSAFRGAYVPAGNALMINASTGAPIQAVVYFMQENTTR